MRIVHLTNEDPRFYPTMGPFLSRRGIVEELGGPVWDDDGKRWWVALEGKGGILGFCACLQQPTGKIVFGSDYVLSAHRDTGVYGALFKARLGAVLPGTTVRATTTDASFPTYAKHGFEVVRTRGRYRVVEAQL